MDETGKIMKRLILNRIAPMVANALAPHQFGFRPVRKMVDAIEAVVGIMTDAAKGVAQNRQLCVLVTLDTKTAFNSTPWILIDMPATGFSLPPYVRRLIKFYLIEKLILVPNDGALLERRMTYTVSQSSVPETTL